ncbi:MAG: deoxynucleoside kinase, partial [Mycoplasmataceae bacterium]|nr:deoxynucleoside kinase [Mycoplasmataceae bacterium]
MNIVISGTVGVGKSTISNKLKQYFQKNNENVFLVKELQNNDPFLDKYYENRPAWSFLIQINFVLDRFNKAYKY